VLHVAGGVHWASLTHCTQVLVALQYGMVAEQCASMVQRTQVPVGPQAGAMGLVQ
jgi:hypothetical protein